MRRRLFLASTAACLVASAVPVAASAQSSTKQARVGVLVGGASIDSVAKARMEAFREGLAELGWQDGGDLLMEVRFASGDAEKIKAFAEELVAWRPDVIVAGSTPALVQVRRQTKEVPVVFVAVSDPVGQKLVESIERPGGNTTGVMNFDFTIARVWLELFKEAIPTTKRVMLLYHAQTLPPGWPPALASAAKEIDVVFSASAVDGQADIEKAIEAFSSEPHGAILVLADGFMGQFSTVVAQSAGRAKLPVMSPSSNMRPMGALLSYDVDTVEMFRQTAMPVSQILKGASAGEIAVQSPAKFELVVSQKAADALGLRISDGLLARAGQIIR